jgi:alpha-methylacyl-CoA racemase
MEGTDVCFAPVLSIAEVKDHPHNAARGTIINVAGVDQPAPAPRFSRTKAAVPTPPSRAGSDTKSVLADWGFSTAEIETLESQQAI